MFRVVSRAKRDQSGSTILLVALAMVVLMGFAAFAVDIGNQYAHRREAQGAVDASVLAGAVESTLQGANMQAVSDEILAFVDTNLGETVTAAQWVNDCPDTVNTADQLYYTAADLGLVPATDCVSIDRGVTEIRTALPTRTIETYFAGVVGVDELNVNAFAHASIGFAGVANPPPFMVVAGTSGGEEVCLRHSSSFTTALPTEPDGGGPGVSATLNGPNLDPCDDSVFTPPSQFFGTLNPYQYADCSRAEGAEFAEVIAAGLDHNLSSFGDYDASVDIEVVDGAGCPPLPNTEPTQTGFVAQALKQGLLSGGPQVTSQPRFKLANVGTAEFVGETMDNKPLWDYMANLLAPGVNVPDACTRVYEGRSDGQWDHYDLKADMLLCLDEWTLGTHDDLFTTALVDESSRFAWIPLMDESTHASLVHINAFVPAFLNKLYSSGNRSGSPDPFCFMQHPSTPGNQGWYMHEAGQPFDCGRNNQNVDQLAAMIIPCGALPDTQCVGDSSTSPGGQPVLKVELSK